MAKYDGKTRKALSQCEYCLKDRECYGVKILGGYVRFMCLSCALRYWGKDGDVTRYLARHSLTRHIFEFVEDADD